MLEFYVESEFRRCQFRQCPVGTHLEGFADWLRSAGYKRRPGQLLLRGAAHLGYWIAARGVRTGGTREGVLTAFARHVPTCSCAHPFAGRDRYHREGAKHLFTHWQRVGVVPSPATAPETVPPVVEHFSLWMRQHRGVQESTLGNYVPLVQEFLAALGGVHPPRAALDHHRRGAVPAPRAGRWIRLGLVFPG